MTGHRVGIASDPLEREGQMMMGLAGGLAYVQVQSIVIFCDGSLGISEQLRA